MHSDELRRLAEIAGADSPDGKALRSAAKYIDELESHYTYLHRKVEIQSAMRVEAQMRAARLAKDARR